MSGGEWFHASRTTVKRSEGRSVVAAAAYRTATSISCEREGITHDYSRKGGVLDVFVSTPEGKDSLAWAQDIPTLTNAMEAAEKRKDAQVGHEWTIALPAAISDDARAALSRELGQQLADRYGVGVISALHAPPREGDARNFHCHLLFTTREIEANGRLGAKVTIITTPKTAGAEVTAYREIVAETINRYLTDAGSDERVDPRSFSAQGITDRVPTTHNGPAVTNAERRGMDTDRHAINAAIIEERIAEQEALAAALARQFEDGPKDLTLETERELARRFGDEWKEATPSDDATPQNEDGHHWQEQSPADDIRQAMQTETQRVETTGTVHWSRAWLGRLWEATETFFAMLRDESGVAPNTDGDPDPAPDPKPDPKPESGGDGMVVTHPTSAPPASPPDGRPTTPAAHAAESAKDAVPSTTATASPSPAADLTPPANRGWVSRVLDTTRRLWGGGHGDTPAEPAPADPSLQAVTASPAASSPDAPTQTPESSHVPTMPEPSAGTAAPRDPAQDMIDRSMSALDRLVAMARADEVARTAEPIRPARAIDALLARRVDPGSPVPSAEPPGEPARPNAGVDAFEPGTSQPQEDRGKGMTAFERFMAASETVPVEPRGATVSAFDKFAAQQAVETPATPSPSVKPPAAPEADIHPTPEP